MPTDFVDLELRLLVLKHGRNRVLHGLARLENSTAEDLEKRLSEFVHTPARRKAKALLSVDESVAKASVQSGRQREKLLALAREFDAGRFLPQLREALRFLAQNGQRVNAKSRRELLPKIVSVLAALPERELDEVLERQAGESGGDSSFARLARAIMQGA